MDNMWRKNNCIKIHTFRYNTDTTAMGTHIYIRLKYTCLLNHERNIVTLELTRIILQVGILIHIQNVARTNEYVSISC